MVEKIILVGYMGSGKSTIGSLVAKKLQLSFIDLDFYIEKIEKLSISEIFLQKGEIYFRRIESMYFHNLMNMQESFVLSLGGGTACYSNNHLLLQDEKCQSFYLQASVATLVERLELAKQSRPLIANLSQDELYDFVAKQCFERSYFYLFSKKIIKIDGIDLNKIVDKIVSEVL